MGSNLNLHDKVVVQLFVIIKDSAHAYRTTHHAVKPFLFCCSLKTRVNSKYQWKGPKYILHFNVFFGKKNGIRDSDEKKFGIRDSRKKRAGMRDQGPPPPPPLPEPVRSRRLIGAQRLLTRCLFVCHFIKLIYYHPTSDTQQSWSGRDYFSLHSVLHTFPGSSPSYTP